MDNINDNMSHLALSSKPSSLSTTPTTPAATSTDSSRRNSSATSISTPPSDAAGSHSQKPSQTTDAVPTEGSIHDDGKQGKTRALRRQALARKISAHLRTLAVAQAGDADDQRRNYIDALVEREPETYTPALAAYFADHPDAIPARCEDVKTQKRKRYDAHEYVSDSYGRSRVDARQTRLFKGWEWSSNSSSSTSIDELEPRSSSSSSSAAARADVGPMGESERGEEVPCAHCARKERKDALRRGALKGLGKLLGRSAKDAGRRESLWSPPGSPSSPDKRAAKTVEAEADHAEQVEYAEPLRSYGTIRVR